MVKRVGLLLLISVPLAITGMECDQTRSTHAIKYTNQIIHSILSAEKIQESMDDAQFCLKETIKLTQQSKHATNVLANLTTLEKTFCNTELQQKLIAQPFEVCYTISSLNSIITKLIPRIIEQSNASSDEKKLAVQIIGRIVLANARMEPFRDPNVKSIIEQCLQSPEASSKDKKEGVEELPEYPLENEYPLEENNYNSGD